MNEQRINRETEANIHAAIEAGEYPEAMVKIRGVLMDHPDNAEMHYLLGGCLYRIKAYGEAAEALREAVRLNPEHAEARKLLDKAKIRLEDEKAERSTALSGGWKNAEAAAAEMDRYALPKKTCPNCKNQVLRGAWVCGYCGSYFPWRIGAAIGVCALAGVLTLFLLARGMRWVTGSEPQPAAVVNNAGADGENILVTDTEWVCHGLGLGPRGSSGYQGYAGGTIHNTGRFTAKKINLAIHFMGRDFEATHGWIDVLNLPPGRSVTFAFPSIRPPAKALSCEYRINEVIFETAASNGEGEGVSVFTPSSRHFGPSLAALDDGTVIHNQLNIPDDAVIVDEEGGLALSPEPTAFPWLRYLGSALLSFAALFASALLVNFASSTMAWNAEWQSDLTASVIAVIAFTFINILEALVGGFFVFRLVLMLAKFGVLLALFKRSFFETVLLIVCYYCLILGAMGFIQRYFG